jgi:hypothetical protein
VPEINGSDRDIACYGIGDKRDRRTRPYLHLREESLYALEGDRFGQEVLETRNECPFYLVARSIARECHEYSAVHAGH